MSVPISAVAFETVRSPSTPSAWSCRATRSAPAAWRFHTATFALNFAEIGAALLGLSRVSLAVGLITQPVALLAIVGAGLLFVGAIPVVSVAAGSAWFYVALPGFGLWIFWLMVTGVGLIRSIPDGERP